MAAAAAVVERVKSELLKAKKPCKLVIGFIVQGSHIQHQDYLKKVEF